MELKSLLVRMGSDTKQMEAGFKKADGLIQANAEKFKKAGRAVTVAGAAIVGTLGLMVRNYVKAGDEVHKMALRTGFSTEALSELKYAAEISGTSLGSLEKGVKKMASSIGEAKLGLKTYTDAFKLIGIEVSELDGLNPEEQFMRMAAGIAEIEDPTQRAYAAQKLLGRAGTELLPLFAEGAAGMEALRQKAREMGISISGPAAKGAADLNDSLTTLKGAVSGVGMTLAGVLAPIIKSVTDKISAIVIKVQGWIKEHPKLAGGILKVVAGIGILATVLGPILIMLPALATGFGILWGAITGPVGLVVGAIAAVGIGILLLKKYWEEVTNFLDSKVGIILSILVPFIAIPLQIISHWEEIKGFFVNLFAAVKKTFLDWAIGITNILAAIPIAKKLAGPWNESLKQMRADMDETAKNVSAGAGEIKIGFYDALTGAKKFGAGLAEAKLEAQAYGCSIYDSIKGTKLFKTVVDVTEGVVDKFRKTIKKTPAELKAIADAQAAAAEKARKFAEEVGKANKTMSGMVRTLNNEIKAYSQDEYEHSRMLLGQKREDQLVEVDASIADEETKNAAKKAINEAYALDMQAMREKEAEDLDAAIEAEIEKEGKLLQDKLDMKEGHQKTLDGWADAARDRMDERSLDQFTYAKQKAKEEYEAKMKYIDDNVDDFDDAADEKNDITEDYLQEKTRLEDAERADRKRKEDEAHASWIAQWEKTLGEISQVISMLGQTFSMYFNLRMTQIDNEEIRRLEAISTMYDAEIEAAKDLLTAEEEKTQERMDNLDDWYDKKKQEIEDTITDEDEKEKALAKLDKKLERKRKRIAARRAAAEESAATALETLEEDRADAVAIIEEDLETKRAKLRRQAAIQEKAVALLSAIVSTAAAIVKALPNIPLAIAVGILGAIQIAIISATPIPLKEGGLVMQPTTALIGEAGPELVIPLSKLRPALAGMRGLTMNNYFYGDINNAGDIDEISRRLAIRTTRMIERGRKA